MYSNRNQNTHSLARGEGRREGGMRIKEEMDGEERKGKEKVTSG